MTAFSGLPAATYAKATRTYVVASTDALDPGETLVFRKVELEGGSARDLCLWHGFDGEPPFVGPNHPPGSFVFAGSRHDTTHGWSVDAIRRLDESKFKTYVSCDGYVAGHGHAWSNLLPPDQWNSTDVTGVFSQYNFELDVPVPRTTAGNFCWLSGISSYLPMSADLRDDVASNWHYYGLVTNAGVQCVHYAQ